MKMEVVVTVKQVVSDYKELRIAQRFHYDKQRITKGMVEILANHGLKVKFTTPQSNSFKLIKQHYSDIIKQYNWNSKHQQPIDYGLPNPSETVFYSKEKYSDLCLDDHQQRYFKKYYKDFVEFEEYKEIGTHSVEFSEFSSHSDFT